MRPVRRGQRGQAGAVKVDSVGVHKIRVLRGGPAAGAEPDLPGLRVHVIHAADDPLSTGDLVFHLTSRPVVEVQMTPAVSLRGPDDFAPIGDVFANAFAGVLHKRLAGLFNDRACAAGRRIKFEHAVDLMSALVVFKRHRAAVFTPGETAVRVRIRKPCGVAVMAGLGRQVKDDRKVVVHLVTGLAVHHGRVFRLHLIAG